jgi:hypothetical protein
MSEPMIITNFFINHPCKAIILPFIFMFACTFIAISLEMMTPDVMNREDTLIMKDPIVIDYNILNLANNNINRDKEVKKAMKDLVRYESIDFGKSLFFLYKATNTNNEYGLMQKDILGKIIDFEMMVQTHE